MVAFIVLAFAALIAAGGPVGFRSSFVLRGLNLGLRRPRHRAALAAMCSVPAEIPTELAAAVPDPGPRRHAGGCGLGLGRTG